MSVKNIDNVNYVRVYENPKFKIYKKALAAFLAVGIALGGAAIIQKTSKNKPITIPEGYKIVTVDITTSINDNVDDFVADYYKESYGTVYRSEEEYKRAIIAQNDLDKKGNIKTDEISIPVVIEENDPYYEKVKQLEEEIKFIEENRLWIEHIVESGDSAYSLASLAGMSKAETMELMDKILEKNHLKKTTILNVGDVVLIINTKLKDLKIALNEAKADLYESLKSNNQVEIVNKTK